MKSMTGFAFRELTVGELTVSVELRSYNSRFLDLSVNLPSWLSRLETRLREYVSARIMRGKVELTVRVRERSANVLVIADPLAARAYLDAIKAVAEETGLAGEVSLSMLIAQEGVLRSERATDPEGFWDAIEGVLSEAFSDFEASRAREGTALAEDLFAMIARISRSVETIETQAGALESRFRDTVVGRFREVLGNAVDEQRVLQEVAALLVKYSINEELVRLRSHLSALEQELNDSAAPGRKADFICQEINREVNTIGSKNQGIEIGRAVIDAKDALENIREQLRNIE